MKLSAIWRRAGRSVEVRHGKADAAALSRLWLVPAGFPDRPSVPSALVQSEASRDMPGRAIANLARRLLRRGVGDAPLAVSLAAREQLVGTDRDGYFRVHLRPAEPVPPDRLWHTMKLELLAPPFSQMDELFIPPPTARLVVISDIDDTVMHTGVGNKVSMLWRLFLQRAENRVAFPGVAALLQALHRGADGTEHNPMLYVSRAPWSIYEVLESFFRQHDIPVGPVLFLREWGMTLQRPLPRRGKGHKLELIRNMLDLYRDLPFILIGDSGQRDPEIYARIVREHPGRVLAIYIRNVSRGHGSAAGDRAARGRGRRGGKQPRSWPATARSWPSMRRPWPDHTGSHCHRAGTSQSLRAARPTRADPARSRAPPRARPAPRSSMAAGTCPRPTTPTNSRPPAVVVEPGGSPRPNPLEECQRTRSRAGPCLDHVSAMPRSSWPPCAAVCCGSMCSA